MSNDCENEIMLITSTFLFSYMAFCAVKIRIKKDGLQQGTLIISAGSKCKKHKRILEFEVYVKIEKQS